MAKPRKRQKVEKDDKSRAPLGARFPAGDEAEKDDEERKLESILFGTKFVPMDVPGMELIVSDGDEEVARGDVDDGGGQLQHISDANLFFVDDGAPAPIYDVKQDSAKSSNGDEGEYEEEDEIHDSSGSEKPKSVPTPPTPKSKVKRDTGRAAWIDPADEPFQISLGNSQSRLRKFRDGPDEDMISGKEYESRLRRQFERINPEPQWAVKARKAARQRRKKDALVGDESQGSEEEESVQDLLNATTGILAKGKRRAGTRVILPPEQLSIERLRDANQSVQQSNCGQVKVVTFHPSEQVPVLCVGTTDRRIRLFNVDGHTSPLLQTLHVPSLPITSQTSAQFHPSGSALLLTGPRPFFYTHDLQTGTTTQHARGLWGATFSSISDTTAALLSASHNSRKRLRNRSSSTSISGLEGSERDKGGKTAAKSRGVGEGMELSAFSPCTGDLLAVAGRGGQVHLVDWKCGAGQVVASLKCGAAGGGVKGLWWLPSSSPSATSNSPSPLGASLLEPSSASSRPHLAVLSGDAEVYLWDVGQRRCVRRWKDEGGFRSAGRCMAGAIGPGGEGWLAIGSTSGFVNMYGADSFSTNSDSRLNPKPIKSIANLVTSISALRFNHDAQLLAIASQEKKDAMRLIHLPSLTSFANWPTSSTPLGHVTSVDFSARSEYLAIGNTRGRVLLYHLRDFGVSGTALML